MEEQTQMAESAVERLNHMNFLLEDSVDFGFDVHHMPHSNDNTWQKFTLGEFHQIRESLPIVPPIYEEFTAEMISSLTCGRFRWNKGRFCILGPFKEGYITLILFQDQPILL